MPEESIERSDSPQGEDVSLKDLVRDCLDASGYVFFVAKIAKEPDARGNLSIDYHYRRYHFSFEDTREAIRRFKEEFLKDVSKGIDHD